MIQGEKIAVTLWITFGMYFMVFMAILADLWSGVRKARRNKVVRSSFGYRQTIDKIAKYYNAMIALTLMDMMQMSALWYLERFYDYLWPMFPFITMLGAMGMVLTEIKSIYEKSGDKVKIANTITVAGKIIKNPKDVAEVASALLEFLNAPDKNTEIKVSHEKDNTNVGASDDARCSCADTITTIGADKPSSAEHK